MTMKQKMLRALVAGLAGVAATMAVTGGGVQPATAASCQRTIAIDPQVTVSEANRTLSFAVRTAGCAAPGFVSYIVTNGTAVRPYDFALSDGVLSWAQDDTTGRRITATITNDLSVESLLEDFKVALVNPSENIKVVSAIGQGRILDDDSGVRVAAVDDRLCLVQDRETGCATSAAASCVGAGTCTFEPGHLIIVPITLDEANPVNTTVLFQTSDGGLLAGLDYVPVNKVVTIPAGVTMVPVEVQLLPHAFTQSGQTFNTHISMYTGGGIIDGGGVIGVVG